MKTFLDVFPKLNINDDMRRLLSFVSVEKLAYSEDRSFLLIYAEISRLVPKTDLQRIEALINQQVLSELVVRARIIEHYVLSDRYNAGSIFEEYRESLETEMRKKSPLNAHILQSSTVECSEDALTIELNDSSIVEAREKQIAAYLQKIFLERFRMPMHVYFTHTVKKTKQKEKKLRDSVFYDSTAGKSASFINEKPSEYGTDPAYLQMMASQAAEMAADMDEADLNADAAAAYEAGAFRDAAEQISSTGSGQTGAEPKTSEQKSAGQKSAAKSSEKKASDKNAGSGREKSFNRAENGSLRRKYGKEGSVASPKMPENDDPNRIYGRYFNEEPQPIAAYGDIEGPMVIRAKVLNSEGRETRSGRWIYSFGLTDFTDSIMAKLFLSEEEVKDLESKMKIGDTVKIKGNAQYDPYDKELTLSRINGIWKADPIVEKKRVDTSEEKRVELHCHTKSSENDGLAEVKDLIKTAKGWGHKAMAITDHGCVYAFPDAFHCLDKGDDFKVIYGMEGYLVDDTKEIVVEPNDMSLEGSFVVFDIETTGFSPVNDKIIEIGAVKVENGEITDRFSTFVDPHIPIPYRIEELTHISDMDVKGAPSIEEVLPDFLKFSEGCVLVAHNASFDMSFISENSRRLGLHPEPFTYVDTLGISRAILPQLKRFRLDNVAKELKVSLENHHRAVDDAECTAEIFIKLAARLQARGINTVRDINVLKPDEAVIKKMTTYHVIILAANETGRVNLYKLVSASSLKYFERRPRIPKSLLQEMREGLIIGSACEAGELYRAVLEGQQADEIERIVNFYDYLEIQPLGNNEFLINDEDSSIQSREDLIKINQEIVKLGEKYNKPVCATCDVHFLNPDDAIYRAILQAGCGYKETEQQPPLYLRTTDEMLQEFSYLGSEKAYEVVVSNTNLIADRIEKIEPVRPDKCPPVIENADQDLEDEVYGKAHELYGDELPPIVQARLEKELHSIISNGYAVMYMIAEKLVSKSVADGYLVGSRGSVGSSLVATMSGITEVNPLPPHYRCPKCRYCEFDTERVKKYADNTGSDMPDANCPVCGEPLVKDGYNIPFETFLGFKGDKEPDIDLNFSGEYQAKAHAYTEVIFGPGQTFRAGTVGSVAEKTAIGYVLHYYEDMGIQRRHLEVERIAKHIEGVRRTSGQHPGGIIVLPIGEEINTFTPVQHPANDQTTSTITTHFDYHSIDHNLLKLDILGHDDPTMIRMIQDLIQIDPRTFPLDSKEVMSLFQSTEALGVTPEEIRGTPLGAMGLPEFGTDNAINMLLETKPRYVSDLIRISGLSHGTNVWHGNAQTLILEGKCTIDEAVCTRDDIMVYLISKGMDPAEAFSIMENVRKGKVAKGKCKEWPTWKEDMIAHDVPDWYIWSCERIEYMFPKAHAAAYVMMALRIAYTKVFYPLAYYAAFFSIRASGFNYEIMCMGKEKLERFLDNYENKLKEPGFKPTSKDADTFRDGRLVQEMYARGYKFVPIDVYKASSTRFQIVSDKELMPSLTSIDGMGEVAADTVVEAAKKGPFTSLGDFKSRTKVSQTIIDKMVELHILDSLPKEDQFDFFDLLS